MKNTFAAFGLAALFCAQALAADTAPRPSTASPGVALWPTLLQMPGLNRERQVRIYLPPGYATSHKRYPVLYMHDAQNIFDDATSYVGEWHVDETLDQLARDGKLELIVVGVDHGNDKRLNELNPWANARFGAGEGREYMDFIVKVVKPLVDKTYRTLPDRAHTAVMGSSMGGLISHYAITEYPQVFSKAGVFSPAYWTAPASYGYIAAKPLPKDARVFMLMGEEEGDSMVPDVKIMGDVVRRTGLPADHFVLKIVPGEHHNEGFWSKQFGEAVQWLFAPEVTRKVAAAR
jgi:predicted alpha/beta superfamily hydrolase